MGVYPAGLPTFGKDELQNVYDQASGTTTAAINGGSTTITVSAGMAARLPAANFPLTVDYDNASSEEFFISTRSGQVCTIAGAGRGQGTPVTAQVDHASGAKVVNALTGTGHLFLQNLAKSLAETLGSTGAFNFLHKDGSVVATAVQKFQSGIWADSISEFTAAAGVTIDGLILKDGLADGRDISVDGAALDSHLAATAAHGATGAAMGTTNVQFVSGKSFADASTFIVDATDATKRLTFDIAGTTGVTGIFSTAFTTARTITFQDVSGTVSLIGAPETLVGKTLTSPTINNPTVSNGTFTTPTIASILNGGTLTLPTGTDTLAALAAAQTFSSKTLGAGTKIAIGSDVAGDTYYRASGGNFTRVGIGTDGQVWTVSGGVPVWADATGGGGGGAPADAQYLTLAGAGGLSAERVFALAARLAGVESGSNPVTYTLDLATVPGVVGSYTAANITVDAYGRITAASPGTSGPAFGDDAFRVQDVGDATKRLAFDIAGSANITGTLQTIFTTAKTLTLPDATDTLMGKATVDIMSNKTLGANLAAGGFKITGLGQATASGEAVHGGRTIGTGTGLSGGGNLAADRSLSIDQAFSSTWTGTHIFQDTKFFVADVTDATKQVRFDVAGTTGITGVLAFAFTSAKTLTFPDLTDTVVTRTAAEALSNKTITAATNTVRASSIGPSGSEVTVSGAAVTGYVIKATSASAATWQDPGAASGPFTEDTNTIFQNSTSKRQRVGSAADPGASYRWAINGGNAQFNSKSQHGVASIFGATGGADTSGSILFGSSLSLNHDGASYLTIQQSAGVKQFQLGLDVTLQAVPTATVPAAHSTEGRMYYKADGFYYKIGGSETEIGPLGAGGGGSGAPTSAPYLLIGANDATLTADRRLVLAAALTASDLGANSTYTVDLATQGGFTAGSFTNANLTVNNKGIITAVSTGSGGFAVNGNTSRTGQSYYSLEGTTSNATPTEIFIGGVASTRISTVSNTGHIVVAEVTCLTTSGTFATAAWRLIANVSNQGGTAVLGTDYVLETINNQNAWDVAIGVTGANMTFTVTGDISSALRWNIFVSDYSITRA